MDDRTLEQLFERFRTQGDVAALGRVFDETAPELARLARRLTRDRSAAEDLVQATFLAAIENARSFDRTRALMPWLAGILVRQAGLARRKRTPELTIEAHEPRAADDPLRQLAARELSDALTLALERLSPADREVLVPLLLDEKRAVEIARELGRRPDTVHMRIHRGLMRLRRLLPAGFALGWTGIFWPRYGMANVRAEIVRHAEHVVGSPPIAAATASSSVVIGGVIMVKYLVLAFVVLAFALAVGWYSRSGSMPMSSLEVASFRPSEAQATTAAMGEAKPSPVDGHVADALSPERRSIASVSSVARIEVVESDGSTSTGALVAMVDSSRNVRRLTTDAQGCIELPASGERIDLVIARAHSLPFHTEVTLDPAQLRVDLPAGRELSGWIRIEGAVPARPIELALCSDRSPLRLANWGKKSDTELAKLFECERTKWFTAKATCGANGEFRWTGLPEDWSGSIHVPYAYTLAVQPRSDLGEQNRRFESAATGVVIEIEKLPCLKGRVVHGGDGEPVSRARLAFNVEHGEEGNSMTSGAEADESGYFEMPVQENVRSVDLIMLQDARGNGRGRGHWSQGDLGPELDVGDLVLEPVPARDLHFVVHDSRGSPILGAAARGNGSLCKPTDENGHGVLDNVSLKTKQLKFGAIGYWPKTMALSPAEAGPLDVVLDTGNELSIEVVGIPPEIAADIQVHLVSTEAPFDTESGWLRDPLMPSREVGHAWSSSPPDKSSKLGHVHGVLSDDGFWIVENVTPGIELSVQVVGALDAVLYEEKLAPLGRSEARPLVIHLAAANRRIEGRVSDADGSPVSQARVDLINARENRVSAKTDSEGRFRFSYLPEGELELTAEKRGYVRHSSRATPSTELRAPFELQLGTGHDVEVEVVDARGQVVPGALVSARTAAGSSVSAEPSPDSSHFMLQDLPASPCTLRVTAGGKLYERAHDPRVGKVRFELPIMGQVACTWSRTVANAKDVAYQVALRSKDPASALLQFYIGDTAEGTRTFEAVAPGEYTIAIETWDRSDPPTFTTVMNPITIVVRAGESTHVELKP